MMKLILNHNPNCTNKYEFANNTNENKNSKVKTQKSPPEADPPSEEKLQLKSQN